MSYIRRVAQNIRQVGTNILNHPLVTKIICWIVLSPMLIPILLIQRHAEKHLEEVWNERDVKSWDVRKRDCFYEDPAGLCPCPEVFPSWIVRLFKPRIPSPRPQTSKAGTLPVEILEDIFKELGVAEVERWRFRGQRLTYDECDEDISVTDSEPVDWLTEPHRQGALCRAAFVCKSWHAAGIRLLYEHVSIKHNGTLWLLLRTVKMNARFALFVKTFTHAQLDYHLSYESNIKSLKKLLSTSTEWRITVKVITKQRIIDLAIFSQMKNLKDIHLLGSPGWWPESRFPGVKFPGVRTLTMEGIYDSYTGQPFSPIIHDGFPNVEVFRFHLGKINLYYHHRQFPMDTSHMHMPNLRELEVINVELKIGGIDLLQGMLATNAATLEKLVVVGLKCAEFPALDEDVALGHFVPALNMDVCPRLKDVTFGNFPLKVPFQDVVPGLVFPTSIERLEIRGSVYPWPETGRGSMGLRIFYDADAACRPSARQHFTKMPLLKEIVFYGKVNEIERRYHPILYNACVDDDVSLKLYWVDRKCKFCNSRDRACEDWLHYDTSDGKTRGRPRNWLELKTLAETRAEYGLLV